MHFKRQEHHFSVHYIQILNKEKNNTMPIHAYPYNAEEISQYKAGQISLISLRFIEISPFLNRFELLGEPLMKLPESESESE